MAPTMSGSAMNPMRAVRAIVAVPVPARVPGTRVDAENTSGKSPDIP